MSVDRPHPVAGFSGTTRLYAHLRGWIVTDALLAALSEALPAGGAIADFGCGIGLATLEMARRKPQASLLGFDRDARRIAAATAATRHCGIDNAFFSVRDLRDGVGSRPLAGAYLIDLLHHVQPSEADWLLAAVFRALVPGGVIVVKEVDVQPWWKRLVCHLTDRVMAPGSPVFFQSASHWRDRLERAGFTDVSSRPFPSWQPYPHLILTGRRPARG